MRIILVCCLLFFSVAAHATGRVAFVVGNGTYTHAPSLKNPINDARLIARTLRELDFEVSAHENLTRREISTELAAFLDRTEGAETTLFYFAGHGLQFERKNFLLGTEAKLLSELDIPSEALELDRIVRMLERGSRAALVFIDACRDNPLATNFYRRTISPTRALGTRGLAPINTNFDGAMITFSASPGEVAYDGGGENSPFAKSLATHLSTGRSEILSLMKRVIRDVRTATQGRQSPIVINDLTVEIYLNPTSSERRSPQQTAQRAREQALFDAAQAINTVAGYEFYLSQFPQGRFRREAEAKRDLAEAAGISGAPVDRPAPAPPQNPSTQDVEVGLAPLASLPGQVELPPRWLHAEHRRLIQSRLNARGYDAGPVDGAFGPRTRSAIAAFQDDQAIAPSGIVTVATSAALGVPGAPGENVSELRAFRRQADIYKAADFSEFPKLKRALEVLQHTRLTFGWFQGNLYLAVQRRTSIDGAVNLAERAGGHLATITSAGENEFLFELIRDDPGFWVPHRMGNGYNTDGPMFGLRQRPGSQEPSGGWMWITGEALRYANWSRGNPDNFRGNQQIGQFYARGTGPRGRPGRTWDDASGAPGLIIEIP